MYAGKYYELKKQGMVVRDDTIERWKVERSIADLVRHVMKPRKPKRKMSHNSRKRKKVRQLQYMITRWEHGVMWGMTPQQFHTYVWTGVK